MRAISYTHVFIYMTYNYFFYSIVDNKFRFVRTHPIERNKFAAPRGPSLQPPLIKLTFSNSSSSGKKAVQKINKPLRQPTREFAVELPKLNKSFFGVSTSVSSAAACGGPFSTPADHRDIDRAPTFVRKRPDERARRAEAASGAR